MKPQDEMQYRPLNGSDEGEEAALRDILTQCFAFPLARWKWYFELVGPENFRVLLRDGRVVAGLALIPMGQWFGGRTIPMTGIAAVGVPPEARAGGIARTLMTRTIEELRSAGVPLSALFASTQHLYRTVGYEQAGTRGLHSIHIPSMPRSRGADRTMPMHAVDTADPAPFKATYDRFAASCNGTLDRGLAIWRRLLFKREEALYAYVLGDRDEPQGYVIYAVEAKEGGQDVVVRDMVATTPAAYRRLVTFFLDGRSLLRELRWAGAPIDPFLCVTEEQQEDRRSGRERWMLRLNDVRAALEQRGYAPEVEGELAIEIEDEVLPGNAGRIVLSVADGRGKVNDGGRGDLRAHVRGFTPLFTGMLSPVELSRIGWCEGTPSALATAERIFAGSQPWMPDSF